MAVGVVAGVEGAATTIAVGAAGVVMAVGVVAGVEGAATTIAVGAAGVVMAVVEAAAGVERITTAHHPDMTPTKVSLHLCTLY